MAVVINGNGNITGLDGVFSADSVNSLVDTRIDSDSFVEHNEFNVLLDARIDSADFVAMTGDQTISGIKTFSDSAQFNTHVHISGPRGGNGQDGIYDAALSLTASNQTTLSVMNDSDGFANLNLGSVDPLGDGSNKSNFWHISYRNLSSHSNKLQNFWYDSSGFDGPFTTLTTDGDFGIGSADPAAKLHVHGSFRQTGATAPFEWTVNPGAADYLKLNAVGYADNLIVANSNGNVGIGKTPTCVLHVASDDYKKVVVEDVAGTDTPFSIGSGVNGCTISNNTSGNTNDEAITLNQANQRISFYTAGTERMRADDSGRVTMPYQPCFRAERSGSQTYSVNQTIIFNSEIFDQGSNYNTSTGVFTAPVTGKYYFSATVLVQVSSSGWEYDLQLVTSNRSQYGAPGRTETQLGTTWGNDYIAHGLNTVIDMDANDTAYLRYTTFGGGTIYGGSYWTSFGGYLIG